MAALPRTISSTIPATPIDDRERDHEDVLEQHPERQHHDAKRRQRVQARERRRHEGGHRQGDRQQPEDDVGETMLEQKGQARTREALEPPDQLHQPVEELLLAGAGKLQPAPARGQPDLVAPGHQLQAEQDGDHLEHVRRAPGRQRQSGNAEQQHEQQREAAAPEQRDQTRRASCRRHRPATAEAARSRARASWTPGGSRQQARGREP